jgi:hypothetical protein
MVGPGESTTTASLPAVSPASTQQVTPIGTVKPDEPAQATDDNQPPDGGSTEVEVEVEPSPVPQKPRFSPQLKAPTKPVSAAAVPKAAPSGMKEASRPEEFVAPTVPALSTTGTFVVSGKAKVELHRRGNTFAPGELPLGSYEIWADFDGSGMKNSNKTIIIKAGQTHTIKCSTYTHSCKVQ